MSGSYCSNCGEEILHDGALGVGHLAHDFLHEFTHLDGKIWRTLRALLLQPGRLTAEYWAGRRGLWIRPLRLYLVISALQLLLAPSSSGPMGLRVFVGRDSSGGPQYNVGSSPPQSTTALVDEHVQKKIQSVYLWIRYFSLLLFAAASLGLYRKRQPYLGAHLIFGLHYYSFDYVLSGALTRLPGAAAATLILTIGFGYLFLSLRRLFGDGFWKTLAKSWLLFCAIGIAEALMVVASLLLALRLG
ncbi:DUF3667 domain-containing protein [Paludibaculum fermentans]|uniref:DUF3667 domain-containing protein n=1 Tax=Paludibaculum fermentans TaxID=1473598 RepID=UPI003EBC1834